MLYSFTARLNYIIYNVMSLLAFVGLMNHVTIRYGHLVGLRNTPLGLPKEIVKFELRQIDQFLKDRYFNE